MADPEEVLPDGVTEDMLPDVAEPREWPDDVDLPDNIHRRCCTTKRDIRGSGPCQAYPVGGLDSPHDRCKHHGGATGADGRDGGGAPEGNTNGMKHGLFVNPGSLYDELSDERQRRADALAASLGERYEAANGREPDAMALENIERIAVEAVKLDLADDWMAEHAVDGNPLMEEATIAQDTSRPVDVERPSMLHSVAQGIRRENRQWMKDMGLLDDPESEKASAMRDAGEAYVEALKDYEDE